MGYKSPFIRFGHTRYEKDIIKLRRRDLDSRGEAYEAAEKKLDELDAEPHVSWTLLWNVCQCASNLKQAFERGSISDEYDDAMLVRRYGVETLGQDEYDWMKDELAKKGEEADDPWDV